MSSLLESYRKYDVMYKHLPGQTLYSYKTKLFWRTASLTGSQAIVSDKLRKDITQLINKIELLKTKQSSSGTQNIRIQQLAQQLSSAGQSNLVSIDQVSMIAPEKGKLELFPRALNCSYCNYFEIPDLSKKNNWDCPNCKKNKNNGTLRQVNRIFACSKCGNTEDVIPPSWKMKGLPTFACPDKCGGIIELNRNYARAGNWRWVCSKTKKEFYVDRYCQDCKARTGVATRMELHNPTQSHLTAASTNFILFGEQKLEEPTSPSWSISEFALDQEREKLLASFGITNIEKFNLVQSTRVTFGVTTMKKDSVPKFFLKYNEQANKYEYETFVTQSDGKGIMVRFDKKKLAQCILAHIASADPNNALITEISSYLSELENSTDEKTDEIYAWICKNAIDGFDTDSPFKALFEILHTFEHALTKYASLVTGLEAQTFTGTVMMSVGAVLIYENRDVSAGGIDYLIDKNRIHNWIFDSRKQIANCENYCRDGCGKCLYHADPTCHPVWPHELGKTYVLPNSLLSRDLAKQFIDFC